jgi:hypothetical protein
MSETWQGLITDSAANLLRFSTPTHTHDFNNHSNGYDSSKMALVQSLMDHRKSDSSTSFELGYRFRTGKDYNCRLSFCLFN